MNTHRPPFPKSLFVLLALVAVPVFAGGPSEVRCSRGQSLQRAVDGLLPGGVVSVQGECRENVLITTDHVTIIGADARSQLSAIDGGGLYGHALTIRARGVTIDGLTIVGAVLVEDGGDNRLLRSAAKGFPDAIKVADGELEVRDSITSGWLRADRGATVNVYDSHIDGRVTLQGSSFVMLSNTDVTTDDLALESAGSSLVMFGGEIDSVVALNAFNSTVVFSSGTRFTGSLRAAYSSVQLDNFVDQISSGGVNRFSRSTLDSDYQNSLLDTVLDRQSSASLQQSTQVTSLMCNEGSVAYCTTGAVVGVSNCGSCPAAP